MYPGTGKVYHLLETNNFRVLIMSVWTGGVRTPRKIHLLFLRKQTSRLRDVLVDNSLPNLAGLMPFIVTKGNDVTARRKIG